MQESVSPRILVVDDSASVRSYVSGLLSPLHADVVEAVDGREGLDIACSHFFDLIITDVEMPEVDGFTLCRQLKRKKNTRGIPVVILSNRESDKDIERGFEVGAAAYIGKTMCKEYLLQRVQKVLGKAALLRGKSVLVVDDSQSIRSVLTKGLEQAGFSVAQAANGQKALNIIEDVQPDIILSDINMPQMDGKELCRSIRRDNRFEEIPFVAMSSNSDRRILIEMMQQGASAYLVKPFNVDQLILLAEKLLSDHCKSLINQRQTLIKERDLLLSSITSLVVALEARDAYTCGHSENVARLATMLARHMQVPAEQAERISLAAKLHDVGKIGIRDNVLLKEGKLDEDEMGLLRNHPLYGANILRPIPSMSSIIDGVLYHHEKMDGTGYPLGLSGSAIPFDARLIAVCDVYDALTSDRPYRKGMGQMKAIEIIRDMRGNHLCPDCVDAFLSMLERSGSS